MSPRITVVVPVYNKAEYLTGALDSLINQTESPNQIVIIDDFSNDGSYEICKKYEEQHQHLIQLHRNEKNSGVSFSRNEGITLATGDYIMFLDADDEYENTCIENIKMNIAQYANENIFITKCIYRSTKFIYPIIPKFYVRFNSNKLIYNDSHSFIPFIGGSNVAIKASFIRENNVKFNIEENNFEDWLYYFTILIKNNLQFVLINKPLYIYTENVPGSLSRISKNYNDIQLPKIISLLKEHNLKNSANYVFAIWLSSALDQIKSKLNFLKFVNKYKRIIFLHLSINKYYFIVFLKIMNLNFFITSLKKIYIGKK